jgi:hypothetical protein
MATRDKKYILRIDSYTGESTLRDQGRWSDPDRRTMDTRPQAGISLWAVISVLNGRAEVIDDGYRSYEEAKAAWNEAT